MADDLGADLTGERVGRDTRERVGPAALQGDPEIRERDLFALLRVHDRQPWLDQRAHGRQVVLETSLAGEVRVWDLDRRVAVLRHEVLDRVAGYHVALGVDDQDRADVRVQCEAGERREQEVQVVRYVVLAALGVRYRHDAVR